MESEWQRSSFCRTDSVTGNCVEVRKLTECNGVLVRNSRYPTEVLAFTGDEWAALVAGIRAGELD